MGLERTYSKTIAGKEVCELREEGASEGLQALGDALDGLGRLRKT